MVPAAEKATREGPALLPPCDGLRVVDFSRSYPGALATMVLADAGAEVIKVEPPGGEPTRQHYASVMWHRGKKSVVADLKTRDGLERARGLVRGADAVVESFRPGVAERLGIGYEALKDENPGLVYCSVTGFGSKGPLSGVKGYEGIVAAAVGRFAAFDGMVEKDGPVYASQRLGSYGAAMLTVQGMMGALRVRQQTGLGQKVETSLLQALTCYDLASWIGWQLAQRDGQPDPGFATGLIPPYLPARTRDGHWIQMANLTVNTLWNFLDVTGLTHLMEDPRYKDMPNFTAAEDKSAVQRLCLEKMLEKDRDEWMEIFMTSDVGGEPFRTTQQGLDHDQVLHNGDVVELTDPAVGPTRQLGPLARFSDTPVSPRGPSPSVGQHTGDAIPAVEKRTPSKGRGGGPPPSRPLEGVTVLEFATFIAVPFMTCLLADMGARVIKVEPITGDLFRAMSFPRMGKTLQGKEALSLDLKDPLGQEAVHRLVKETDILVHNFRPGVPERLGIDFETLQRINPRLIYFYLGAYGSTGPHSHRSGFHPMAGAVAGGPRFQLGKRLPPPPEQPMTLDEIDSVSSSMRVANEVNPDPSTALGCAAAALMALHARQRTGRGQYIETSMICCNLYANADDALSYDGKPERMLADTDYNGLHALYRMYQGKEGWIFLACPEEREWPVLAEAVGLRHLIEDPRFRAREGRLQNDDALAMALSEVFSGKTAEEWQRLLTGKDIACVQVFEGTMGKFMDTVPFVKEQGFTREVKHASLGRYWRHGPPLTFSDTPGVVGPNTFLGEHTRSILKELGYSEEAVAQMEAAGTAVYTDPDNAGV